MTKQNVRFIFTQALCVLSVGVFFVEKSALAYPGYISYGYNSCAICHYNPQGNGILTDYGRGVAASKIAGNPFYADDEEAVAKSSLLFGGELPDWLRADVDVRILHYKKDMESDTSEYKLIPMKLDASAVFQNSSRSFFISANGGYYRKDEIDEKFISREHYVGWLINKKLGLYGGFMDMAYGLRVPDHITYARKYSGTAENDQTHGLMLNWGGEEAELAVHAFMGNYFQDSDLRQKGLSLKGEYGLTKKIRPGFSLAYSKSEYRKRLMGAMHGRVALQEGSSLLAEMGMVKEGNPDAEDNPLKAYVFVQNNYHLVRGLGLLFTAEAATLKMFEPGPRQIRFSPGFQWIPFQRFELRGDIGFSRIFGEGTVSPDNIDAMVQMHLWM